MVNPLTDGTLVPLAGQKGQRIGTGKRVILAAGPLSKQPGSTAYRFILLAAVDGEYSVHTEFFEDVSDLTSSSLAHGHYYGRGGVALATATEQFAERVSEHADYLCSLFREPCAVVEGA